LLKRKGNRKGSTAAREQAMERETQSPLAVCQAHLKKGELAYQWQSGILSARHLSLYRQ
jgi:hypothetical protein